MFKLVAVTLAALYVVLLVFGDDTRRPAEVARAEPASLTLVDVSVLADDHSTAVTHVTDVTDQEAIRLAIAAGEKFREDRRSTLKATRVSNNQGRETMPETVAPDTDYWYVTGSKVNLRLGPSTADAVVGQVVWGDEAEVLADQDGWYQIRLADGSGAGWIFGRFLDEQRPG